ncbi:MAG: ATP-binding protein [Tannerella sp.]|jgi:hypothetical protein|nr:ATP-binding protein [Tannerella sp.]
METKRLKLPIGIQTFDKLRTEGYVYVDKTEYLVNMIDTGSIYFFARPRRFGKSLTVSTLDALFSGKRELFKGLAAEQFLERPDFQPSPVIRLDMSDVTTSNGIESLQESILNMTYEVAKKLGVEVSSTALCGDLLSELIAATAVKYNRRAVILLDEYDKPYTDFVNDREMADKVRNVLRDYYVRIKAKDEYIRFTFITGISKFARFGVFSVLNSPNDISMSPKYAGMCGYTEEEVVKYFPDYLEETANGMQIDSDELLAGMRDYYDGFCFDDEVATRLYNPYSTLLFFEKKRFLNFWVQSGKPKMIADYMKNRHLTVEQFHNFSVSNNFIENPGDMDVTPPEGFLYQSGYLALRRGTVQELALDYPNAEVLNAMSELVTQNMLQYRDESYSRCRTDLLTGLKSKKKDKVIDAFNRLLACIPYGDYTSAARQGISNNEMDDMKPQEWLYRTAILSFLQGCGVVVAAEMHSNKGRADLVVAFAGVVWVIEIKVAHEGESAVEKAEEAYRQIIDKNYAATYPDAVCLGLAIDDVTRQISASLL